MEHVIKKGNLKNEYLSIPSKSFYHRALILSAFKSYPVHLIGKPLCGDVLVTIDCLNKMGADIRITEDGVIVNPIKEINYNIELDCKDSGTTYRFFKSIFPNVNITGSKRLLERVSGTNKTSQYISGNLLRKEIFNVDFDYDLTGVPSLGYIDITNSVIRDFKICPKEYVIEGDYSNAANFLVLGAIKGEIKVKGLNIESIQGDREILKILEDFGATVIKNKEYILVRSGNLKGINIDGSKNPDLVPILAVLATFASGKTEISNVGYLRYKESDRLKSVSDMINNLGGHVETYEDELVIYGSKLHGGLVKSYLDHRIIMATGILAQLIDEDILIDSTIAVSKSDPTFFDNF